MAGGIQRGKQTAGLYGGGIEMPKPETLQTYIDAPNLIPGIKVYGDCFGWKIRPEGQRRPRMGRGSNGTPSYRHLSTLTSGMVKLHKMEAAWPAPNVWKGAMVNLVHVIHIAPQEAGGPNVERKITIPVMLGDWAIDFDVQDPKKDTAWPAIGWVATGPAVFAGWPGTQPTHTEPTKTDQQQWEGTGWTIDLEGLQSSGEITIDWWSDSVADNDVDEINKLTSLIIGKGLPIPFKKRPGYLSRNAKDGGICVLRAGLTTTADDWRDPRINTELDQDLIFNSGSVAGINIDPGNPGIINTEVTGQRLYKLNDQKIGIVNTVGPWTKKNEIEKSGTYTARTISGIGDSGQFVKVYKNTEGVPEAANAPVGLQVVETIPQNITSFHSKLITRFAENTQKQEIEFAGTYANFDVSDIRSTGHQVSVYNTGSSPTNASAPAGLQNVASEIFDINPNKKKIHYFFAKDTAAQSITQDASSEFIDPSGLESQRNDAAIDSTPGVVGGYVARGVESKLVTHDHAMNVQRMGLLTSKQAREFPGTYVNDDVSDLTTTAVETVIHDTISTPSPNVPSGLQRVGSKSVRVTDDNTTGKSETIFEYGKDTSKQKWEQSQTYTLTDPSGLESRGAVGKIDGTPSVPGGFVSRGQKDQLITHDHTGSVTEIGLTTTQQDRENSGTAIVVDPVDVFHRKTTSIITHTGTLAELETSIRDANRSNLNFDQGSGRIINANRAEKVLDEVGDDKQFIFNPGGAVLDNLKGKPAVGLASVNPAAYGDTAAKIHINVEGIIVGGVGGFFGGRVMPVYTYRRRGTARYRRRYYLNSPTSVLFPELEGKTNNAAFCGRPSHSLMYIAARYAFAYSDIGIRTLVVDYLFDSDSELFMNDGDLPDSGSRVSTGGFPLLAGSGFYIASIFDAFALLSWPADGSFSAFQAVFPP